LNTTGVPLVRETPVVPSSEYARAAKRVRQLSWVSLVWMGAEGLIAVVAGIVAGSIALIGFGIDSAIEGFASAIIVWRFTGSRLHSHATEQRAQKLVAIQFFLLAPYVAFEAVDKLITAEQPETSWLGMALVTTSVIGMPLLGRAKVRLAQQLGSPATRGEGNQNLLCAYLAAAVLVGLAGNALFGLWWLDPVAALVIAGVAVREGLETWRGEGCCAAPEFSVADVARRDDCCA
jgi:divalent metal cation (Fe/Co/Zn/Cd) transporter